VQAAPRCTPGCGVGVGEQQRGPQGARLEVACRAQLIHRGGRGPHVGADAGVGGVDDGVVTARRAQDHGQGQVSEGIGIVQVPAAEQRRRGGLQLGAGQYRQQLVTVSVRQPRVGQQGHGDCGGNSELGASTPPVLAVAVEVTNVRGKLRGRI
jgi:hypothetical protein